MQIELIEKGEHKEIHVQDMPKRQEAQIFLEMLNHLDPFIHETPACQNSLMWRAKLSGIDDVWIALELAQEGNASSASAGSYSSR